MIVEYGIMTERGVVIYDQDRKRVESLIPLFGSTARLVTRKVTVGEWEDA